MIETMFVEIYQHEILEGFEYFDDSLKNKVYELKEKSAGQTGNEWLCTTFNTLNIFDLFKEAEFQPLMNAITDKVKEYSNVYGVDSDKIKQDHAWLNLAHPGDYQEFHIHARSHFSIVYYIDVPINSGSIHFKNHRSFFDMFSMDTNNLELPGLGAFCHQPLSHELLIFRSYLPHMVDVNRSDKDRISLSANFIVENNF